MTPIFDDNPVVYTNGAFLKPMRVIDETGKEVWIWYVSEFVEDSFFDGKVHNPKEFASSKEELLKESGQ